MTKDQEWKLNQAILNIKSVIKSPKAHREVKIIWLTVAENYCNEVAKDILKPKPDSEKGCPCNLCGHHHKETTCPYYEL